MPLAVFLIGYAIFAQGTSELMLAGLLPEIAGDLGITIPQAGMLITGFAIGMLIGAPTLAILTLRWRRKRAMIAFMLIFAASHVVSALTSSYEVLLATRVGGAFVYAGFWAVGASTAMALVPAARRGRAMSIVAGGLTVATVIGLPAGAWIGQHLGWRGSFWAVAGLTLVAVVAVLVAVPEIRPTERPQVRTELRGLATPRLWLSYAMTAVSTAALLGTFSYLAAMLIETTRLDPVWVPAVLLTYGLGALIGIAFGGRAADVRPTGVLVAGFAGLLIISVLLALNEDQLVPVVILVFLLGLAGFGTNPALNSRVFGIAPTAPTLAVAGNISSFNVGISLGPWLGGLALTAGLGYPAVAWIGAGLAVIALVLLGIEVRTRAGRSERVTASAGAAG
jgi:DHA1 family chloramphenicol resistance protein-like MFS transporter